MDPITLIVTALAAGATAGATSTAEQVVKDAYAGLKALILRRFGGKGDVKAAVEHLEGKPESTGRKDMLKEELAQAGAGQDDALLEAARKLLALAQPALSADHGSAVATGRSVANVGDGNLAFTGDVQGGITIIQGGGPPKGTMPPAMAPDAGGYDLAAVRDLLLAAFSADELRRLFVYTSIADLRPAILEFGPNDGLAAMAEKAVQFCLERDLLPDLLRAGG
jgi:hypothetical protein